MTFRQQPLPKDSMVSNPLSSSPRENILAAIAVCSNPSLHLMLVKTPLKFHAQFWTLPFRKDGDHLEKLQKRKRRKIRNLKT